MKHRVEVIIYTPEPSNIGPSEALDLVHRSLEAALDLRLTYKGEIKITPQQRRKQART